MHPIFRQFMEWFYSYLALGYSPKRVGPETQCVVHRPVIGVDIGHEHIYELEGDELQIWRDCDHLVEDPRDIEINVVEEVVETTWQWDWDELSDNGWAKLMYHFAVVEDSEA